HTVKQHAIISAAAVASVLLFAGFTVQAAHANQMDALMLPAQDSSQVQFMALRTMELRYPEDSLLAKILAGKAERLEFSVHGNDAQAVVDALNKAAQERSSPLKLENATVNYVSTVKGYSDRAQMSYKVAVSAQMSKYVLQKEQDSTPAILDLAWRSLSVQGPVSVTTEHGVINVNQPAGALDAMVPGLAGKLAGADKIMQDPLLNFGRFSLPMKQWHFLFDVTGEQLKNYGVFRPGEGATVSVYSIGESSFREGKYVPEEMDATIDVDGAQVKLHASTPPPSGQVTIAGYAKAEEQNGVEYVTASSKNTPTPVLGFQLQVLMALGGMMGAIAVFVLVKARR
ncbi:MAG: hypothetical protein ABI348_10410, partial [Nitrososphaera sp.]